MRLFIALEIPDRTRYLIKNKINIIKNNVNQDIKWVEPDKWHITLKFLGYTEKNKINDIKTCLDKVQSEFTPFALYFDNIGGFPNLTHPRVLYAGVKNKKPVLNIYHSLENKLAKKEFEREHKKYIPHLTFARSRNNTNKKALGEIVRNTTEKNFLHAYMQAKIISLKKSELKPSGAEYVNLFSINLTSP